MTVDTPTLSVEALQQQRDEATRRAESLHRVIELISSELALKPLLTRIVESAVDLIDAQYGTIGLVKESSDGPVVQIAAIVNMPPLELEREFPPDTGLAGYVLRHQQPVCLPRYGDLDHPSLPEFADHTVIGIPIWWRQRMIGFFGLGAEPPHRFDAQDLETISLVARHAAIAIENAQRYQEERRRGERLALIERVGRIIVADLQLNELLQNAADAIHELLGYENVAIPLIEDTTTTTPTLVIRAVSGLYPLDQKDRRLPIDQGMLGVAVQSRRIELVNNVTAEPRYVPIPGATDIQAEVAIPMLRGDQVLGVLNVESHTPFDSEDITGLQIIADQLVVAIEHARLFEAERRRAARTTTINYIGQLMTSSLSLDETLQTAIKALGEHLQYHYVALLLTDPHDPDMLVLRGTGAGYEQADIVAYRQSTNQGIVGTAARLRRSMLVTDVQRDPRYVHIPGVDNTYTELAVPLMVGDRLLGVLNIESPEHITSEDATGLETVADQLSIAIENARLFEEEQRRNNRITAINRIGQLITGSLSLDEILHTMVGAIGENLRYDNIALLVVDPDDPQMLVLRAFSGVYTAAIDNEYRQSIDHGIIGAAARTQHYVLVTDVQNDPRYIPIPDAPAIYSELAVPVTMGDRLLGVLNIESSQRITPEDAAGFEIVADQLGIAIENARLFATEQRRATRIAGINQIGRLLTSSFSYDILFQTAVEAIREHFKFDYVSAGIINANDPKTVVLLAHAGDNAEHFPRDYRQNIHTGVVGLAFDTGQRVVINNVRTHPQYVAVIDDPLICTNLAVPIVFNNRALGVINIESRQCIDQEDAEGIEIVADQLGAAMENARLFGGMQQVLEETQLLYATSQRISTAMSVEEVVAAYLEQVAARGRYACSVVLLEQDEFDQRTAMIVYGRWSPDQGTSLEEERWPFVYAPFTPQLDAGQIVTFPDVHADPQVPSALRQMQAYERRPALALIPLMVRGKRIGMVALSYVAAYEWARADLQPYQATAAQLATAIDSRQQHLLLSERGQQIAVLEERRRLARELHDSVTQSLFSMSLLAQVVPDLWQIDREEAQTSLEQVRDLTRSALAEMRALLFELRPADQAQQDLVQRLRQHVGPFERRTGIKVAVEVKDEPDLPDDIAQAFLRIAQEALNNVSRHAQAQHAIVKLQGTRPCRLSVIDNGRGFDLTKVSEGRFGLISMRERAAKINAHFQVCSAVGQGTEIIAEWPDPAQKNKD